jgi:hypothetical protein
MAGAPGYRIGCSRAMPDQIGPEDLVVFYRLFRVRVLILAVITVGLHLLLDHVGGIGGGQGFVVVQHDLSFRCSFAFGSHSSVSKVASHTRRRATELMASMTSGRMGVGGSVAKCHKRIVKYRIGVKPNSSRISSAEPPPWRYHFNAKPMIAKAGGSNGCGA